MVCAHLNHVRDKSLHRGFCASGTQFGTPERSLCASFPGKDRKKVSHINFNRGDLGVKNGVPNGLSATKSLVYCFCLPFSGKQILDAQILGSNFLSLFFFPTNDLKNSPSRNSPPKIHLPKFNPEIEPKNSHCTSAGPFG